MAAGSEEACMRVKVGDTWHEATPDAPIAVELTAKDRENIAAMLPDATRYGVFTGPLGDAAGNERRRAWLGD
jgi:hypothetical protein